jgi:DNA-binding MarR family transcriptional regulator
MPELTVAEFADKLNEVMPDLMKEFVRRQAGEFYKGKITLPQFLILDCLARHGECKMTLLAQSMKVSTAAMTGVVERLVNYGYVTRVSDPADRRIINIRLSAKGAGLVKNVNNARRQMIIDTFGKISQEERQTYLGILMRIRGIMAQENS